MVFYERHEAMNQTSKQIRDDSQQRSSLHLDGKV